MIARRLLVFLLCLGFVAYPSWADAAPSAKEKATAKTAWTLGKRLALQGKHEQAAEALRDAVKNDPKAQYQLDLARALVKIKAFGEAIEQADAVIASGEANAQKAKQVAEQLKREIDQRMPTLKIQVTGAEPSSASVTVNGESAVIGKALRFDPGSYTVRGRVGSQPEVSEQIELAETEYRTVTLQLGKGKDATPTEAKGGGGNMAPAAVLYAVGGAGLAVGAVMGVLAFNKTGEVEELCGGTVCPPELADDVALAQDYGTASTVTFAIGGLAVAAALILTFTVGLDSGDEPAEEKKKEVTVTPYFGPLGAGVHGTF